MPRLAAGQQLLGDDKILTGAVAPVGNLCFNIDRHEQIIRFRLACTLDTKAGTCWDKMGGGPTWGSRLGSSLRLPTIAIGRKGETQAGKG